MKLFNYYLSLALFMALFVSCSKKEDDPAPSGGGGGSTQYAMVIETGAQEIEVVLL